MNIKAKTLHHILMACLALGIAASAASVWYSTGWLTQRADKLVEAKLEGIGLEEQQARAFDAQEALTEYGELRSVIQQVAPDEKEQEKIIAELYNIADESNIAIQSLSFASSDLGDSANAPAPAAATQQEAQGGAAATQTPTTPTPSRNTITQTERVDGLKNVVGLNIQPAGFTQIIRNPDGSTSTRENGLDYDTILNFLESLERNRRQMIIDQISITPITGDNGRIDGYTLTLALTALIAT